MSILTALRRRLIIAILLGAAIFLALSIFADFQNIAKSFQDFNFYYLPIILALAFCNYLVRFVKWQSYLRCIDVHISIKESFIVFISGLIMSISPGKFGEVLKSYLLKQLNGTPISKTAPVVLAERFTDFIALLIMSSIGIQAYGLGSKTLIICFLLVLFFLILVSSKKLSLGLISVMIKIPRLSKLGQKFQIAYESIYTLVRFKILIWTTIISIASWFCECLAFWLIFSGFNIPFALAEATFIYAFSTIVGAITMLPGGLGATELSMTGLLLHFNVPKSIAAAVTILVRLSTLWFAVLVGSIMLYSNRKRLS